MLHRETTDAILKAFYKVYNTLGFGFLEKVYEQSMAIEISRRGLSVRRQAPIKVFYESQLVGEYFADLLVDDAVIVELKAAERLIPEHEAQLLNYLKATEMEVGLLLNFGPTPSFKREVFTNARKRRSTSLHLTTDPQ